MLTIHILTLKPATRFKPQSNWEQVHSHQTVFVDSIRGGRMPNQPDDVFNLTLGYDIGGFSARLTYVYTEQYSGWNKQNL